MALDIRHNSDVSGPIDQPDLAGEIGPECPDLDLLHLSKVATSLPISVIITDPSANIQYVNPEFTRLTSFSSKEVAGRSLFSLSYNDGKTRELKDFQKAISEGRYWKDETLEKDAQGNAYWVLRSISPILGASGTVAHYLVLDEDISEKKLLEKHLAQCRKMASIGQYTTGINHDFNNLLLAVLGFTSLQKSRLDPQSEAYEFSEMIEALAHKGTALTRQLLAAAIDLPAEQIDVDVNLVVVEVLRTLAPALGSEIESSIDLESDLPTFRGDPGQLQHIVMNLCLNARDAMPRGGRLHIITRSVYLTSPVTDGQAPFRPGPYIEFSIVDSGVGIDEDDKTKIFEPFFTTRSTDEGNGLGLTVVRRIANDCGGAVRVQSNPGEGSTFQVYLPIDEAEPDPATL